MNISRIRIKLSLIVSSVQVKGNDHQSVEAILIREKDKNKFSSIERAWLGGAL